MAVKKAKSEKVTKSDVVVETPVTEEEMVEVPVVEEVKETPVVEVPEVKVEEPKATVDVDTEMAEVDKSKKPAGNVRIKMRVDHKCTIAMVRYDLKAGVTYTVPENVKKILNNAGLLAPL